MSLSPPGEYLSEEIEVQGITQKELAARMGRPVNTINEIVNGKKAITAETALQLESVMDEIPARFWLNLEPDYQVTRALIKRRRADQRQQRPGSLGIGSSGRTDTAHQTAEEPIGPPVGGQVTPTHP